MSRATKAHTLVEARKLARSGKPIVRKGGDYGFEDEIKVKAQDMRDKTTKKLVEKRVATKKLAVKKNPVQARAALAAKPKVSPKIAKYVRGAKAPSTAASRAAGAAKGVLGRAGAVGAAGLAGWEAGKALNKKYDLSTKAVDAVEWAKEKLKSRKPKSGTLGKGSAANAAKSISGRGRMIEAAVEGKKKKK